MRTAGAQRRCTLARYNPLKDRDQKREDAAARQRAEEAARCSAQGFGSISVCHKRPSNDLTDLKHTLKTLQDIFTHIVVSQNPKAKVFFTVRGCATAETTTAAVKAA